MFLREVLQMARRFGAFTAAQAAVNLGLPLNETTRLDKAVEGGLLKAVDVAGMGYRDPMEAVDVILSSVDLSVLQRAEREKLI